MIGTLTSTRCDSFTVATGDAEQTFPRSMMTGVELSAGSHTHKAVYALYGAAGCAVLGAALGFGLLGGFPEGCGGCDGIHQ